MPLGVAGAAHAEVAAGLDLPHQLGGVVVVMGRGAPFRDVPPEGQHVADAALLQLAQHLMDVRPGGGGAGQVGQGLHAVPVPDARGDAHGVVAGAAARAVGDAHEVGSEGRNLLRGLCHRLVRVAGLGREDLERQGDFVLAENVNDFHGWVLSF